MPYICDAQSSKVVPLAIFGASGTISCSSGPVSTQSRGYIRALLGADPTGSSRSSGLVSHASASVGTGALAHRGHSILVGTASRKMLSVADTTLDLLVLQLVLHALSIGVVGLILGILAPVNAGSKDDVLADRGGIMGRTGTVFCASAKLAPCFAVGNARVHSLGVCGHANTARGLDFLTLVIVPECDGCLCAVFVRDGLRGR